MDDIGPVPTRFPADADLARRLVAAQFPDWAQLPVRRVANEGWDNQTFHLGDEMLVRLPSAEEYALAVDKEQHWLPKLAPQLPLPIPAPVAKGVPGEGYPHHWSVYRWLDGEPANRDAIGDLTEFAGSLADFLAALQRVDPTDGPAPGLHNWYRGGSLSTYGKQTARALETLQGHLDCDLAGQIWRSALHASWDGPPVWFHGDVAHGNLLVKDGALAAVIDFGTCGVGDPACDLTIAWTLLTNDSRQAFRDVLAVDSQTWARARGWALWKALAVCAAYVSDGDPLPSDSARVFEEIVAEYAQSA